MIDRKKKYYPNKIEIMESGCKIPIQNPLDHINNRIIQIPNIRTIESHMNNLEMLYKWQCCGNSDQSQYRIHFKVDLHAQLDCENKCMRFFV